MLELKNLTFTISSDDGEKTLVNDVSVAVPREHFMAIVGPSGCGKTTLLRTIAGLNEETSGEIFWDGRNLAEDEDFAETEVGYVPQFSIAYDHLTVDESIEAATKLRVRAGAKARDEIIDQVLAQTGLTDIADRRVAVLSGGQKRRLALAMELASSPDVLLCDEVTSGLDPHSEREIVSLLHDLSRKENRLVLSVTHSLASLEAYDSVLVLHEGSVVYHGPADKMCHYFSVDAVEDIYPKLQQSTGQRWAESWKKHGEAYAYRVLSTSKIVGEKDLLEPHKLPSAVSQLFTLLGRRWSIFLRDRTQLFLQLAIIIGFPLLVSLFSDRGKDPIRQFAETRTDDIALEIQQAQMIASDQVKVGSAVSGVVMFQVVLLCLMGSNNAAREIAGEREIFEKEKFGGVRPGAYIGSKILFLCALVLVQSLTMAGVVEAFWPFRGDFLQHFAFLLLVNAAMTSICLGISSLMKTAEQASLMSIYLVGFQLPLSGAVLALPASVETFTRPFISAYWAWSGSMESLQPGVRHAVRSVSDTTLSASQTCTFVLAAHIIVGIIAAWIGSRRHMWE